MSKRPAHKARRRPPFFHPAMPRTRTDGWSVSRQCEFLVQLYVAGSVGIAAQRVGMTRASAYRLRDRADGAGFAFAWDHVLTPPGTGHMARPKPDWRKVTNEELIRRAEEGLVQPVVYRGAMVGIRWKPDISAALRLMRRSAGAPIRKRARPSVPPFQEFLKQPRSV